MRNLSVLDALFPSVRQELLAALLLSPEKWWYMSELAAHLRMSPSSLQRELDALTASSVLERKQDGRRIYYKARTDSAIFHELRGLFAKTAGIVPRLQSEMRKLGDKVTWTAIYGSVARDQATTESDIDILVVGEISMAEMLPILGRLEKQFGREVNAKHYSESEFREKMRAGDHFLRSVMKGKLVTLTGSADELEKATSRA